MESGILSDGLFFFEAEFGKTATDTVVRNIIRLLFLNGFFGGYRVMILYLYIATDNFISKVLLYSRFRIRFIGKNKIVTKDTSKIDIFSILFHPF